MVACLLVSLSRWKKKIGVGHNAVALAAGKRRSREGNTGLSKNNGAKTKQG